jgi:hypothetical protein
VVKNFKSAPFWREKVFEQPGPLSGLWSITNDAVCLWFVCILLDLETAMKPVAAFGEDFGQKIDLTSRIREILVGNRASIVCQDFFC